MTRWLDYLTFCAALGTSSVAGAYCDPAVDSSVRGEFGRSKYVALVRVTAVTWLDERRRPTELRQPLTFGSIPGGLDPYLGAYYYVTLKEAVKGRPPRKFTIFSENTTARTPLALNTDYLVFLYRQNQADEYNRVGDLMIDNCGNSGRVSVRRKTFAMVKRLQLGR